MDQTQENLTEDFIDEFYFDDTEDNRRLEHYHEIYDHKLKICASKKYIQKP